MYIIVLLSARYRNRTHLLSRLMIHYIYIYIYIDVHIYIYIYIHRHTQIRIHVYIYTYNIFRKGIARIAVCGPPAAPQLRLVFALDHSSPLAAFSWKSHEGFDVWFGFACGIIRIHMCVCMYFVIYIAVDYFHYYL